MTAIAQVAIVGAGPYGLSIAAHLSARGLRPVVFGRSMSSWREGMPRGMRLKSEGFASSLSDPAGEFTLKAFCEAEHRAYADINFPIPLETFVAYGEAFQKRFVPQLDNRLVQCVERAPDGFALRLEDGAELRAHHVILATGIAPFRQIPEALQGLSKDRLSHSAERADYARFAGAKVLVVGAGASATDVAAELLSEGAEVALACRSPQLRFYPGGKPRRWFDPVLAPMTPVGPGWRKWIVVSFPRLFRRLPEPVRVAIVKRVLGPAPGWFIRNEIEGKISVLAGCEIAAARETPQGAEIELEKPSGERVTRHVDHVIAATGFRLDVRRLDYLDEGLLNALQLMQQTPRLSAHFESSVPGLYFVGTTAAYEFGPLLRFVCGADFAARRVAAAVAASVRRKMESGRQAPLAALAQP
jgi:thioredoxin reductase